MFYVYVYSYPDTNIPFYVGKGQNDRYLCHLTIVKAKSAAYFSDPNKLKLNIIDKILRAGNEPVIELVYFNNKEKLVLDKEIELIKLYGRIDLNEGSLSNMTDGGEGTVNRIVTDDTRNKLSDSTTQYYNNLTLTEREDRFSNFLSSSRMNGKCHTDNTKYKISQSNTGKIWINNGVKARKVSQTEADTLLSQGWHKGKIKKDKKYIYKNNIIKFVNIDDMPDYIDMGWELGRGPMSSEQKKNIGNANKGNVLPEKSDETRAKISNSMKQQWATGAKRSGMLGKAHTSESKQKISDSITQWHKKRN